MQKEQKGSTTKKATNDIFFIFFIKLHSLTLIIVSRCNLYIIHFITKTARDNKYQSNIIKRKYLKLIKNEQYYNQIYSCQNVQMKQIANYSLRSNCNELIKHLHSYLKELLACKIKQVILFLLLLRYKRKNKRITGT